MPRVLQITDKGPGSGGIRQVVEDHAALLGDLGWQVRRLRLTRDSSAVAQTETLAPIAFAQSAATRAATLAILQKETKNADVIHLHLGLTAITPTFLAAAAGLAPLVVSLHDIAPFPTLADDAAGWLTRINRLRHAPARRAVWRAVCDHAAVIHAPSEYLADLARRAGAPAARICVLAHVIANPTILPVPLTACAPIVVYAGLLSRPKGAHLLIPAVLAMPDTATQLVICGDGPMATTLVRDVARHGLADRVMLTGKVDRAQVLARMAQARAVIHPSLIPEGFGLTLLEAMLLGRPVAGFAGGATAEWLRDDDTGLVTLPTATALGAALARLVGDTALGERLGRAGEAQVRALCAPHTVRDGLGRLYATALADRRMGA